MCCCSLKKDVKPDLKEDAWQLILKGKILPTTFSDWVEVLITIHSCLHYSLYLQKFKWKKRSTCTSCTLYKNHVYADQFVWLLLLYMWLNSMCRFIHRIWQLVKIFFMNKNFDSTVNHIQQTIRTTILSGFIFASNFVVGKSLATEVAGVLEDTSLEPGSRLAHLNQVKMLCYLLCQYMEMFEDDSNEKSDVITTGKVNNDLFYMLIVCTLKYIPWEIH